MKKCYNELLPGEVFHFAGHDWLKLKNELCILKNVLEDRNFDDLTDNWKASSLRRYLNQTFYQSLLEAGALTDDFVSVTTDLIASDGLTEYGIATDYISLLTTDAYRENRSFLPPISGWWWLATPFTCNSDTFRSVHYVTLFGTVGSASNEVKEFGVRPVCQFSPETLVAIDTKPKDLSFTREWLEKWAQEKGLFDSPVYVQVDALLSELKELS